jgi:acetate kinase
MAVEPLVLAVNPGSASRKYALFKGRRELARLHYEYENDRVICNIFTESEDLTKAVDINNIGDSFSLVMPILQEYGLIKNAKEIPTIGIRIVAPSEYFLQDRLMDDYALGELINTEAKAPIHVKASIDELESIRQIAPDSRVIGVSDSSFHITKPDVAWNYGINLAMADRLGIKRFGYHGLSNASVVRAFNGDVPRRMVVCHVGSGVSVSAILNGVSQDNTMGYTPLEGVIMASRSGSLDTGAALLIRQHLGLNEHDLELYLNKQSGLLGLSGSSGDIRLLVDASNGGDHLADLALRTYAYNIKKAIGQMVAVLDGIDALVFTGTAGLRSSYMRNLITENLDYFGLGIDKLRNDKCYEPIKPTVISKRTRVAQIIVMPINEEYEIANHAVNA